MESCTSIVICRMIPRLQHFLCPDQRIVLGSFDIHFHQVTSMHSVESNNSPRVKLWTLSFGRGYFVCLNNEVEPVFMSDVSSRSTLVRLRRNDSFDYSNIAAIICLEICHYHALEARLRFDGNHQSLGTDQTAKRGQ